MADRQVVLTKAIEKAVSNNFRFSDLLTDVVTTHIKDLEWHVTPKHVVVTWQENTFNHNLPPNNRWVYEPRICAQTAIRVFGELHAVHNDLRINTVKFDPVLLKDAAVSEEPIGIQTTEYKLQDLAATIPVETHQLKTIDFHGTIPAYDYHRQQMVLAEDPVKYLEEHM